MKTGKTIRGTARLAFDAVEETVNIVEGMYRNISSAPLPFGDEPEHQLGGIAGLVHQSIRKVNGAVRDATELALGPLSDQIDKLVPVGEHREAAIAALNGICGDHLEATENPLALQMHFRQLDHEWREEIVTLEDGSEERVKRLQVMPREVGKAAIAPKPDITIALHGLCMNDRHFYWRGANHAESLANELNTSLVYLRYNSGKHISTNGREFATQLQQLVEDWPVPVKSINLLGFSMGGLVARSGMHYAQAKQLDWLSKVKRGFYVVSPHHGSVIERGGYWFQKSATFSPYTKPLSALGRIRSDGVTDLRHGNVQDADWQHHDEHEDNADHRSSTPLIEGIQHYAIATTLSKQPGERIGKLLGDGLVHPSSGTGRHDNPELNLNFPEDQVTILYGGGHLSMLQDKRVGEQLTAWVRS